MTTTPSARIGLNYDSTDDGIDPQVPNFTRLDAVMPILWVTDGTTPADTDLYDGAIVGEITSGKVWAAKKNGGGTFDKKYLVYPYSLRANTPTGAVGTSSSFSDWGWTTYLSGRNSSGANLVGSFWVAPIKGIYTIKANCRWAANATNQRAMQLLINGVVQTNETELLSNATSAGFLTNQLATLTTELSAGDTIKQQVFQNSGSTVNLDAFLAVVMINPTY